MSADAWRPTAVLVTCEHGGRDIPPRYRRLFRGASKVLATHRGYDIGALGVAQRFASQLAVPLVLATTTRLLVDLNRSPDAPGLLSEYTRDLADRDRDDLLARHYTPYRTNVCRAVAAAVDSGGRMLHVSVHSCVDVLDGVTRDLDIALLFDPARPAEVAFCNAWRDMLAAREPGLRFRFNEPYLGTDDGLTTTLRAAFDARAYVGIEVEVRQGMIGRAADQRAVGDLLADTVRSLLDA